jgi:hypothetical protein
VPAALLRAAMVPAVAEVGGLAALAEREPTLAVDGCSGVVSVLGGERRGALEVA